MNTPTTINENMQLPLTGLTNYPNINAISERNGARFFSERVFKLNNDICLHYFSNYYLLYWDGNHFIKSTKDCEGILTHQGIPYIIRYYPNGTNRGNIIKAGKAQIALSFRVPQQRLNLPAIVIVKQSRIQLPQT